MACCGGLSVAVTGASWAFDSLRDLLPYCLICLDWVVRDPGSGLSTALVVLCLVVSYCLIVSSSFMEISGLDTLPASLLLGPFYGNAGVLLR